MKLQEHTDLSTRISEILQARFPGAQVEVGRFHDAERAHGQIIWAGFEDVDQLERQRSVHDAVREGLGPDAQGVSIILAYTPHEIELMDSV